MPAITPKLVDSDAIEPGAVYSDESTWVYATNEITLSHAGFADVSDLTIQLTMALPATVLQIAQVDFRTGVDYRDLGIELCCDEMPEGIARPIPMYRRPRYGAHWQNVFMMWGWAGVPAGTYNFKVKSTRGTLGSRKNALIVMRI